MSFLVSRRGMVFESDLGAATRETAAALTAFDPGCLVAGAEVTAGGPRTRV